MNNDSLSNLFDLKQGTYLEPGNMVRGPHLVYGANGIIGSHDKYMYDDKTVLVSCRGANCGVVHITKEKSWVSNNSIALIPKDEKEVFPAYFYHLLKNESFVNEITGSAQPQIVVSVLGKKKVLFHEVSEQKKIAEILSSVDEVIELTEKEISKLQDLKKGMMQELLTKGIGHTQFKDSPVGRIPESWDIAKLRDVCSKVTDGTHDTPKVLTEGVPFITGKHIRNSFIDFQNCSYLSSEDHEIVYKRCNPEKGDVIYVNIGQGVATPAYIDVDFEFSMKNIALLKPKRDILDGRFLEYHQLFKKQDIYNQAISGGAQPFLSLKAIGDLLVRVPSLEEQIEITKSIYAVQKVIEEKKVKLEQLNFLKKGLMQDLLTGKVRVEV